MIYPMSKTQVELTADFLEDHPELEIFEKENRRSLQNIVPTYMKAPIEELPKEYFVISETQLHQKLRPSLEDSQLRMAFWSEYMRAQLSNCKMNMRFVYSEVYTQQMFTEHIVKNPNRLAWILRPPTSWVNGMKVILNQGIQVMHDAVYSANIIEGGRIEPANLNAVLKIVQLANTVINGLPTLKTETKALNINVNQSTPINSSASIADLERQLIEARKRNQITMGERDAIQIESTDGEILRDGKTGEDQEVSS